MARKPIALVGLRGDARMIERFMAKVDRESSPRGCWLWLAGYMRNVNGDKRACFRISARHPGKSASRASYALFCGDVPDGALVLHSCDDGMCVNPEHLRLGTHEENTADMLMRGRGMAGRKVAKVRSGYRRPFISRLRKLSDDAVRSIRADGRPIWKIAFEHGVAESTVWGIRAGRRKAHVKNI